MRERERERDRETETDQDRDSQPVLSDTDLSSVNEKIWLLGYMSDSSWQIWISRKSVDFLLFIFEFVIYNESKLSTFAL